MEQVVAAPPPLPPKTRRSPPTSTTTVLNGTAAEVFTYSFPEVYSIGQSEVSTSAEITNNHVVKIRIQPHQSEIQSQESPPSVLCEVSPCIRISVNASEQDMIQRNTITESFMKTNTERTNTPYFFCGPFNCSTVMSSGQVSPSDTLDSGTCSDLDSTPPPLPKKKNAGVSVTVIGGHHNRAPSLTSSGAEVDSDDNESSISCDSLNSGELPIETITLNVSPSPLYVKPPTQSNDNKTSFLPQGLLKDIRNRSLKLSQLVIEEVHESNKEETECTVTDSTFCNLSYSPKSIVDESTYEERKKKEKDQEDASLIQSLIFDTDSFYDFHLNENVVEEVVKVKKLSDESFAGYKDLLEGEGTSTIRSAKGTIRGVKNRVRAGIATFLQINSTDKSYKEKDEGKVVVYTTTMGIVRETYNNCTKVKQILRTLLIKFEERDVFMSIEYQGEIRDRMRSDHILVPQVFVDGQHIGNAETVERLNESGELRRILKPYKSLDVCTTCKACGGYRLLPCPFCNGSKKSVHRNDFTTEFVALKCMNCDEVGLIRCNFC